MSSHHIVRDEQEPALLVLNARFLRNDAIANLLEWSPTILAPYSQLEELTSLGYKPDLLLAAPEEVKEGELGESVLFETNILEVDTAGDVVARALRFLSDGGHKAVNILSAPFQLPFKEVIRFSQKLDIVFYSEDGRWVWLRNGLYRKWLAANSRVTVFAGEASCELQLTGFPITKASVPSGQSLELTSGPDGIVTMAATVPFLMREPL